MINVADENDLERFAFVFHKKPFARNFCIALRS